MALLSRPSWPGCYTAMPYAVTSFVNTPRWGGFHRRCSPPLQQPQQGPTNHRVIVPAVRPNNCSRSPNEIDHEHDAAALRGADPDDHECLRRIARREDVPLLWKGVNLSERGEVVRGTTNGRRIVAPDEEGTTTKPGQQDTAVEEQASREGCSTIKSAAGPAVAAIIADDETRNAEIVGVGAGEFADMNLGPVAESYERGRWLLGLLALQSTSSFVLDKYQDLLREHVVVTLFLTMLVGAGGNAGNQSAIKVIRGLATGRFTADAACAMRIVGDQAIVGFLLGTALAAGGFVRVWVTEGTTLRDASAISMSLFFIVMASVLLGSALPFGFARAGVDPAHAGTTIQVAMDIVGVGVTCVTCSLVLTQLDQALSSVAL